MTNVSEELARLAELRDKGVLTAAEFEAQKARVLAGQPVADAPSAPAKGKAKIGCIVVIAIVVVLAIIGAIAGGGGSKSSGGSNETAAEPAAREVTALELARAYSANEVAAQKTYGDQTLRVTGTVQSITLDFMNDPVVQFKTENELLPAQASFDKSFGDRLQRVAKGDKLTVTCTSIQEVISAPMLSNCSL